MKKLSETILSKQFNYDDDGRIVIDMLVKDDSDFLSVFSSSDTPVISSNVAEFLESATHTVPPTEKLTLKIKSDAIDDNEKPVYEKAIKQYYLERYQTNKKELKFCNLSSIILSILGVLTLTVAVILQYLKGSVIWAEVVDIAAWVFLWEAVDVAFFRNRQLKLQQKRYSSFIEMKIIYVNL